MFENVRRVSSQLVTYGSADVAVFAVNFLLLPIYTRVLSTEEYGALALLLACEAFLKVVFRWGLDISFLRIYYDYPDERDRRVLAGTLVMLFMAGNGGLGALLVLAARPINTALFGSMMYVSTFDLLIVNGILSTFLVLPLMRFRAQERASLLAGIGFGRSFGTVVVRLIFVVGLGFGVFGIVLADTIVSIVLVVGLWRTLVSMTALRFSVPMARAMLSFGLPRVPQGLLHQGMGFSDRFFLQRYLPLSDVGVYQIGNSMASLTKLYSVSFNTAWLPFAFDSMRRQDAARLFARMGTYALGVLVLVTLAVATLSESLLALMTPEAFHGAGPVIPLLAIGVATQATGNFLSTSLSVAKRTYALPVTTAIAVVVTIIGHVTLIPRLGILGAALAVTAGQVALAVSVGVVAQRHYPIPYEWGRALKLILLGGIWYMIVSSFASPSAVITLLGRSALLGVFPAGLFAVRFFRPAELHDLRRVASSLTRRG